MSLLPWCVELKLLCKVCEGYVPVSEVEAHAKTCAISFPVQVIRFEATEDAELPAKSKKNADPEVRTLADLPLTVLNALDKSEVPRELYEKHLDVLVNVRPLGRGVCQIAELIVGLLVGSEFRVKNAISSVREAAHSASRCCVHCAGPHNPRNNRIVGSSRTRKRNDA